MLINIVPIRFKVTGNRTCRSVIDQRLSHNGHINIIYVINTRIYELLRLHFNLVF